MISDGYEGAMKTTLLNQVCTSLLHEIVPLHCTLQCIWHSHRVLGRLSPPSAEPEKVTEQCEKHRQKSILLGRSRRFSPQNLQSTVLQVEDAVKPFSGTPCKSEETI